MKKIIIAVVILLVAAILWWTVAPLFITKTVDDELSPEIQAALDAATPTTPNPLDAPSTITVGNPVIGEASEATPAPAPNATPVAIETTTVTPDSEPAGGPVVSGPFAVVDTPGHRATGAVRVIESDDTDIVRFENYDGTNGPDLFVYLAKDLDADEFVNLGRAKGNQGNINYEVPDDVDLSEYKYVMTWCRAFGVLFDYAEIN